MLLSQTVGVYWEVTQGDMKLHEVRGVRPDLGGDIAEQEQKEWRLLPMFTQILGWRDVPEVTWGLWQN